MYGKKKVKHPNQVIIKETKKRNKRENSTGERGGEFREDGPKGFFKLPLKMMGKCFCMWLLHFCWKMLMSTGLCKWKFGFI